MLFHGDKHYYFGGLYGGDDPKDSILVLKENTWTWSNLGKMKISRSGHEIILVGDRFMIFGGVGSLGSEEKKNEACALKNGQFSCTKFYSSLDGYAYYPILYLVDDNYNNC